MSVAAAGLGIAAAAHGHREYLRGKPNGGFSRVAQTPYCGGTGAYVRKPRKARVGRATYRRAVSLVAPNNDGCARRNGLTALLPLHRGDHLLRTTLGLPSNLPAQRSVTVQVRRGSPQARPACSATLRGGGAPQKCRTRLGRAAQLYISATSTANPREFSLILGNAYIKRR